MDNCRRCGDLPDQFSGEGKLFLNSAIDHTLSKVKTIFDTHDHPYSMKDGDLFFSRVSASGLKTFAHEISDKLSDEELTDTRALWMDKDEELKISDLSRMTSLEELIGRIDGDWLIDILKENRLYNEFQPIVLAENPEEIHGYECLLRARDDNGERINPGRIFETARKSDLLFQLDREARINAVKNSAQLAVNKNIFINFMPTSIYDPEYCLKTTMNAVKEHKVRKNQLVFEVVETEEVHDRDNLMDILNYYREQGVNVALDDFGSGYSSLSLLKDLNPDYIKLDMDLVQSVTQNELQADLAENIISISQDNGIVTLAEGVETLEEWKWFKEKGIDYIQGFLFAEPNENPPENISVPNGT
jgi:EAL domain-containing protein (putative c-di-GMP-specific phosphodiesterase class I)